MAIMLLALLMAAEAWVMWSQSVAGGETQWTPMGSYQELETCNAHTLMIVREVQSTPELRVTKREGNMVHFPNRVIILFPSVGNEADRVESTQLHEFTYLGSGASRTSFCMLCGPGGSSS